MAASQAMRDVPRAVRRRAPRASRRATCSRELVHAEVDGERLTDEKIYGFLRLLLPAGAETTFRVMGNALYALLTHPDDLARVSPIPSAAPRGDRGDAALGDVGDDGEPRRRRVDTEIAGCPIAAGSPVNVLTGSADRDERPLRRRRRVEARSSDAAPPRVRHRSAPVPRDAPRPARAARRARRDPAPAAEPAPRPRRAAPRSIQGYAFRGPDALPVLFDAAAPGSSPED